MSAQNWSDLKERVRQAIDIVDLAGSYFELRRKGRVFVALCPWHNDSHPSMTVNAERQLYRCWVCNKGGDVFNLIMDMEGVTFPEALRMLADRAGIPMEPIRGSGSSKASEEKKSLLDVMAWAEAQYHDCLLRSPEAEIARRYLQERGISQDSIRRFHLGCAPDNWNWIQDRARREKIELASLADVGVLGRREGGGSYYDRFKGRVLFSIRDAQGRPVALGGRVLPSMVTPGQQVAKYINSPETPLFSKGTMLYGFSESREAITRSRTAVVVEGYTDCVLAHQHGLQNVVAVLGTALGEAHIRFLKRFADKVVLLLDGDEAGRKRANEVLPLFIALQVDLRVLTLPDSLDPADFVLQHGPAKLQQLISEAADALEHKFRLIQQSLGTSRSAHAVQQAVEDVLSTLAQAPRLSSSTTGPEKIREASIMTRLAHLSGLQEATLRARLSELRSSRRNQTQATNSPNATQTNASAASATQTRSQPLWERELLEALLWAAEQHDHDALDEIRHAVAPELFSSAAYRKVFELFCERRGAGHAGTFNDLMIAAEDGPLKALLVELDEEGAQKFAAKNPAEASGVLKDVLDHVRWQQVKAQQGRDTAMLKQTSLNDQDAQQLFQQIFKKQQERQGISEPKEG